MKKFMEHLLTTEPALPDGMSLQIQRAHKALTLKPGPDATPRSIVINFQQHDVKETVLKLVWKKKIHLNNKPIFFDHDYAYEVINAERKRHSFPNPIHKDPNSLEQRPTDL